VRCDAGLSSLPLLAAGGTQVGMRGAWAESRDKQAVPECRDDFVPLGSVPLELFKNLECEGAIDRLILCLRFRRLSGLEPLGVRASPDLKAGIALPDVQAGSHPMCFYEIGIITEAANRRLGDSRHRRFADLETPRRHQRDADVPFRSLRHRVVSGSGRAQRRGVTALLRTVPDSGHGESVHMPFDTHDLDETLTVLRDAIVLLHG